MAVITTWGAILENVCGSDHYLGLWILENVCGSDHYLGTILENVCGSDHYLGSDIRECLWQ